MGSGHFVKNLVEMVEIKWWNFAGTFAETFLYILVMQNAE